MKPLKIHNTLTRQEEDFVPLEAGKVKMYVCGVTVYDYCHLGHARALITFDVIYRTLKYLGYEVTFVRNFTDIDDKIIQRAHERHIDWQELTREFIQAFHSDTAALGCERPTIEPKATDHIPEMIEIIRKLEEAGIAYFAGGDVFYSVRRFESYGKLSGKNIDDLEAGARVDVMDVKKDPLDFALWKSSKPGEPAWDSPWGKGRPGWHIECSAMSMKYLTESFDIHGGGRDLIFPHHENEIAQSEGCSHKTFAKYWVHNGFVNINTEKMSKSLGNFLTIRDILGRYPGEVIRLFVLSAHYRSPLDYTDKNIEDAASGLRRYYQLCRRLDEYLSGKKRQESEDGLEGRLESLRADIDSALANDFNTAIIIGAVFEWVRTFNKILDEKSALRLESVQIFLEIMQKVSVVFGVFGAKATDILAEMNQKGLTSLGMQESEILGMINERRVAKKAKDFARADAIRHELKEKGIQLKDNPDGTTGWEIA